MNPPTDIETRLRASLTENARHAPPGDPLADRILAELDAPLHRPRGGWRTWTFPLLAAAAIAAVAFTVAGVGADRHTAAPAATHNASPTRSATLPPTVTPTATPTPAVHHAALPLLAMDGITGFRAIDATYVGTDRIWALGDASGVGCAKGGCLTLLHTSDAGRTWKPVPVPTARATSVRFADDQTGFLFGPNVLERTTDGGAHWARDAGGAVALETLDQTVIKVSRTPASCTGSCAFDVSYEPLGSTGWTRSTSGPIKGYSVQLMRARGVSYLLVRTSNPASAEAQGEVFRSSDAGMTWLRWTGCPGLTGGSLAADGTLDLMCGDSILVGAHTDSAHYVAQPTGQAASITAVDAHTFIVVADRLFRSTDGGVGLRTVLDRAPIGDLGPPGFENASVGHWINDNGRSFWTTTDGGATWTGAAFSR